MTGTAKLALAAIVLLLALGLIEHGVSLENWRRLWQNLFGRPGGPVMAAIAALHDGLKDARTGRSPYFWTIRRTPRRLARKAEA